MQGTRRQVEVGDGRVLDVVTGGQAGGLPVVFHNGSPSAALLFPPLTRAAEQHGLSLVTWSRPGYARSTARPGRSIADVVPDVTAVLDAIAADSFVALGWSGGGSCALACAALLPGRCRAAATLASFAPYGVAGLDWLAGMGPENVVGFRAALAGQEQLAALLEIVAPAMSHATPDNIAQTFSGVISDVDKDALTGEFGTYMAELFRDALTSGITGWRDDHRATVTDWGFNPADITRPVAVWHGAQDRMVPFEHGKWLAEHIPGAIAHLHPDQGHLSLVVTHINDVVGNLATLASS